tara:strand:- start:88 stop:411 length:324 start_codon:yes stop_codon:yes gene_type:complete
MEQITIFGTDFYKLVRKVDPQTSKDAAQKVDTARWEKRVLEIIKNYGDLGCIQDDVLQDVAKIYGYVSYSTVTARFKGLQEKNLIYYTDEKRKGSSNRMSRVRIAYN